MKRTKSKRNKKKGRPAPLIGRLNRGAREGGGAGNSYAPHSAAECRAIASLQTRVANHCARIILMVKRQREHIRPSYTVRSDYFSFFPIFYCQL